MHDLAPTERFNAAVQDAYQRGVAHGRKTAEAEYEAERHAMATLANSLTQAVGELTLYLNPDDMAQVGDAAFDIRVRPDRMMTLGGVRLTGRAA